MITPDHKPHIALENVAKDYLISLGYSVFQQTYHEVLPDKDKLMLQSNFMLSALYIRSRSDRLAISKDHIFEFEVKTHSNDTYYDLLLEIFPVIMHLANKSLIDCIYICEVYGREFGFSIRDIPKVRTIFIPDIPKNKEVSLLIKDNCENLFGITKDRIRSSVSNCGSNDPFMIIDKSVIAKLPHWKELITNSEE